MLLSSCYNRKFLHWHIYPDSQSPCMDEISTPPEQRVENETQKQIMELLNEMELLCGRISSFLRNVGRRLSTVTYDPVPRYWEFIQVELSVIVASLRQMYTSPRQMYSSPELGMDLDLLTWLRICSKLADRINTRLVAGSQQATRFLHRAAARCFSSATRFPRGVLEDLWMLFSLAESSCWYMELLQDDNRTSRTSSSVQLHRYKLADTDSNIFLVGIQGAVTNMLRWFMEDEKTTHRVISMVGPAGVGKTTLAMEVYRQLRKTGGGHDFQCCATANVSQKPDMKELLKHILSQINKPTAIALEASAGRSQIIGLDDEMNLLVTSIKQCLQDKRYLIVIDDIWRESDWDVIKYTFPHNSKGSRIMITTQLRRAAHFCCNHFGDGLVHEVKPLSELDSRNLLSRLAFGPMGCCPEALKPAYDEILRRCEGIPLFISHMSDWLRDLWTNYRAHDIVTVPELPRHLEQSLATIYGDLPYNLKVLLMYMSIFPGGYMFDKDSLPAKWIAEGLVSNFSLYGWDPKTELTLANKYFSELFDGNVVTRVVATNELTSHEEKCLWKVGYFLQQFLASKSADMGFNYTSGKLMSIVECQKLGRRLSLHLPDPELPMMLGQMDLSHTRSLYISGEVNGIPLDKFSHLVVLNLEGWQYLNDEHMLRICKMFLLRHLSLKNTTGLNKLPPEIKELQLLVTLDISHTKICELPSQVCELKLLQTLDLRCTLVRKLPEEFLKLRWFQSLLVGGDGVNRYETATEILEGISRLYYMRKLETIDLSECSASFVEALGFMEALRVLAITWSFHQCTDVGIQQALCSSIQKWNHLKSLTIYCGLGCCMDFLDSLPHRSNRLEKFKVPGGRFTRIPRWIIGLDRLTSIEITVRKLEPKDLSILRTLPKLECLMLGLHFIPEEVIKIDCVGFNKLERLSISCRVPWLAFNVRAMKELAFLELKIAGSPADHDSVPSEIDQFHDMEVAFQRLKFDKSSMSQEVVPFDIDTFIENINELQILDEETSHLRPQSHMSVLSGIDNLRSLSEVTIQYNEWYTNSHSVKRTVWVVREQVIKHRMPINLFINGQEVDLEDWKELMWREISELRLKRKGRIAQLRSILRTRGN